MFNFNIKNLKKYRIRRTFKESVEPEEIFLDEAKPELEGQKLEVPLKPAIFKVFFALIIFFLLVLAGQAFWLQVVRGKDLRVQAENNRFRSLPDFAPRGIIYDKFFKQLVFNMPSFDLVLNFRDLPKDSGARTEIFEKTAKILGIDPAEIPEKIKEAGLNNQAISLAEDLSHKKVLQFEAELGNLPGLALEKNNRRQYIFSSYFSHILGYLGRLSEKEKKAEPDYFSTEKIGKAGLEFSYEKILRGQPGQTLIEVDSSGRKKREVKSFEPVAGQNLLLTLDNELQRQLYDGLNKILGEFNLSKAAAVAINPKNGGILAMVSLPSFDNNLFSESLSLKDFSDLSDSPLQPLFNRAISGQYAPGSTIKPLLGAAALEEKTITPQTTIFDSGEIVVQNQYNPDIIYRFTDWQAHGLVNLYSAIAQSCDVYFYTIGGGYGKIEGLGVERIKKYFENFSFGRLLGIDLPGEKAGLVPDEAWKEKNKKEDWYLGDTYHLSIGQGDLLVTPLQLVSAIAAIANGGKVFQPRLVDKIIDSDKNIIKTIESEIIKENFVSSENLEIIRRAMRQAVTDGSAYELAGLKVNAAAKTGTAQVAGQKNSNAWFVSFAPYEDPQIVLVILAENAGEGSKVAAPVAREVLEWYFDRKF